MTIHPCARRITLSVTLAWLAAAAPAAKAGVTTKTLRETAEYVLKKFGKEAGEETVESLSGKIATLAAKHGDEAVEAVRRVGPRTFSLVEEAGEHGTRAVQLMARVGDDAVWVVARPRSLAIFAKHGDEAAEAMIKHKGVAEPLLEQFGEPAARTLNRLDGRSGRRLAMLSAEGDLARIGRTPDVLGVIEKHGDRAMDFVWRHKGVLAGGAALAAFLSDPEPYLNGVRDLATTVGDDLAEPLGEGVKEVTRRTHWTGLGLAVIAVVAVYVFARSGVLRRRPPA